MDSFLGCITTWACGLQYKHTKIKRHIDVRMIINVFKFKDKLFFFFISYVSVYITMMNVHDACAEDLECLRLYQIS